MPHSFDVFINCPFDEEFKPLFEAVHFTVTACGYAPRCALEDDDGAEIRLSKLCRIIEECPRSVHDLSRVQLSANGFPRFNMPFELGLMMGAKHFGPREFRGKTAAIMVSERYKMPAYLSDLGGNDPKAHGNDVKTAIDIVRKYLHPRFDEVPLPGASHIHSALVEFKGDLPVMASALKLKSDEVDAFRDYNTYSLFVSAFLVSKPVL